MRQRAVNEKAVENIIGFLNNLKIIFDKKEKFSPTLLQHNWGISKSTFSICKKLSIILNYGDNLWEFGGSDYGLNRHTAIKILESLRQRSDKQADTPISDLWVLEIAEIKKLITEVVHNTKKQNKLTEGFKMSDRVYIAGQIAAGWYSDPNTDFRSFNVANDAIIEATDDLLSKLNK